MSKQKIGLKQLFRGSSEIARQMRNLDWSQTLVSEVETWPQSLRMAVSILLNSHSPLFLWWGQEYAVFYNDAYCSVLGTNQHLQLLGQSAKVCWSEIGQMLVPLADRVIEQGKKVFSKELKLITTQNDETHWQFALSPLWNENGIVEGIWGECLPLNELIRENKCQQFFPVLLENETRLKLALETSQTVCWERDLISDHLLLLGTFNDPTHSQVINYSKALKERVHPQDRHKVHQANETAIAFLGSFEVEHRLRESEDSPWRWILARGTVMTDVEGKAKRIVGVSVDITERKQAEEALRLSDERFRLATRAVNGLVYDWDVQTGSVYRSDGLYQLIGVYPQEASPTGDWWRKRLHPDDLASISEIDFKLTQGDRDRYDCEYRVRHEDGRWIDVWDRGYLLRDAEGQLLRVVGFTADITYRKQTEAALRASEARFRGVVESNLIGICFWREDGQITDANEVFVQTLGYSREEMQAGQVYWQDITPLDYQFLEVEDLKRLQATGSCSPFEKECIAKNGERIPLLIGYAWLVEFQKCAVAFVVDISDRKRWEKEREALLVREQIARTQAERANHLKDEFLAVVSHELRSPLNAILGWSEMLLRKQLDESMTERALDIIARNARLQTQLIEDLLDVSRILRGKIVLNMIPVNLSAVIKAALDTVQLAAETKAIKIQASLPTHSTQVLGDAARLQQIIWNLLSNAVKFTPEGGRVEVRLERVDKGEGEDKGEKKVIASHPPPSHAQIIVTDTGKGITPDFLPYVFDYFRQADSTTTRRFGGLGLGLAIVWRLTELHGGTVRADSLGEGLGATFTVTLPLVYSTTPLAQGPSPTPVLDDLSQWQILVVDDEADTRELLMAILTQYGATVRLATGAIAALQLLDQYQPDLLISDIAMPERDGYTLITQVRQLSPQQGGLIPAIALTAFAGEINQRLALEAGFQCHLSKPVDPLDLVQAIIHLLSRSRSE